jgi:protocatechuate 3,4-dioxygenase beta subunit
MTVLVLASAAALIMTTAAMAEEPVVGGPCQGCDAVFAGKPAKLSSVARIAPVGERGEPMIVTGRVTARDGQPRANIVVYAYQTDAQGHYPKPARSLGPWPDRHGRLRGWVSTDAEGRYTFETIRPGSYPSNEEPQHIHMHVIEPGCSTYYIDNVVFTDDKLLPQRAHRDDGKARGGSGVTTPRRDDASGPWKVTRDIRLGLNIPGHRDCPVSGQTSHLCADKGGELQQLRIYEVNRDNREAFHERFAEHALRIMGKYDFNVVDMWESDTGEKLQFIYVLSWPDRVTMDNRWKAFLADPDWIAIKKRSAAQYGELVESAEGQPLNRVSYSPACE